jgi:hypothetical protein
MTQWPHWEYYCALDDDLANCARYVEFCYDNMETYSVELARILLTAGAEVDVIFKVLCCKLDEKFDGKKISQYRKPIINEFPDFGQFEVSIPRYGIGPWQPWCGWPKEDTPSWWRAYQDVKHNRDKYFWKANLDNTICSVMGLYSLLLHYYKKQMDSFELSMGLPSQTMVWVPGGVSTCGSDELRRRPDFFSQ